VTASLLLVARDDPAAFAALVESLVECDLGADVDIVVADDGATPELRAFLRRLEGDVTIVRAESPRGRRAALASAAGAARGEICIALATTARPRPGFVEPLAAAIRAGADLAGPTGYASTAGGGLLPADEAPGALALHCLAARRTLFAVGLPAPDPLAGPYELALASGRSLAIAASGLVGRDASGPEASVIVCTQDRADALPECVACLVAEGADDIVLVENASRDDSAEVCAALAAAHPAVRHVREPAAGLARARNTGAAAARHEVLAYLDDDARPAPGWLCAIRDAFGSEAVAIAGGPIHALAATRIEPWLLPPAWAFLVSVLTLGDADGAIDPTRGPWGANWAVRRRVLEAVGGFDEALGPSAGSRLGGEESAVGAAVARRGLGEVAYRAAAAVGHQVPAGRLEPGYLAMRAFRVGAGEVAVAASGDEALRLARAVRALAPVGNLGGDADAVLAAIASAPLPLESRLAAAAQLGIAAACAVRLDLGGVLLAGGGRLTVRPGHARGFVERPGRAGDLAAGW
jgi:glycosyltransferase involved in cell wall biosynthesis